MILLNNHLTLKAAHIDLTAYNQGKSEANFVSGKSKSIAGVKTAKQPTYNWYDTGIQMDGSTVLESTAVKPAATGEPDLRLHSESFVTSNSKVFSSAIGILYNANSTYGEVHVQDENNINIGAGAVLTAKGFMDIEATDFYSVEVANWITEGKGLLAGSKSYAVAEVNRSSRVNVGDGAQLTAGGNLKLTGTTGEMDYITVFATAEASGGFAASTGDARYKGQSNAEVNIGKGVSIIAEKNVNLLARGTSHHYFGNRQETGIHVQGQAFGSALRMKPSAQTTIQLNFNSTVNINQNGSAKTVIQSKQGDIRIDADNDGLIATNASFADGYSGYGTAKADTNFVSNLHNLVWIDRADLTAKGEISVWASNSRDKIAFLNSYADCENKSVVGSVKARNYFKGDNWNQVRTSNKNNVTFKASSVVHDARAPWNNDNLLKEHEHHTHKSGAVTRTSEHYWEWTEYWRCDFCGKSAKKDGNADTMANEAVKQAGNFAKLNMGKALETSLTKALSPLVDIQRQVARVDITRARFGEEEIKAMSDRFVLELNAMLTRDARIDGQKLDDYRVWNNESTFEDVYLLPNATRLFAYDDLPQYIAETFLGDLFGMGEEKYISIVSALTEYAYEHPILSVGSSGTLDMLTGTLTLPARADHELYLNEVSASWILEQMRNDFIQLFITDPYEASTAVIIGGKPLPERSVATGLTPDRDVSGWMLYWLGDTPETVQEADQELIFLLVNEETDEMAAFRTSLKMIESDEKPIEVSLYLFRDSSADRLGVEKYNMMFFDTAEGKHSVIKVITDVLEGRTLEVPKPMRIVLRQFSLADSELPVFSMSGSYIVMMDGTKGSVNLFDGLYQNTFDGDTFESDYIVVKGIADGDLTITLKQDQPVWPEWTGETEAIAIGGEHFVCVDGLWITEALISEATAP